MVRLVSAIGTPDGVIDTFFTPTPYQPNSLRVGLNGQFISFDAYSETGATGFKFEADCIPIATDQIMVWYREI